MRLRYTECFLCGDFPHSFWCRDDCPKLFNLLKISFGFLKISFGGELKGLKLFFVSHLPSINYGESRNNQRYYCQDGVQVERHGLVSVLCKFLANSGGCFFDSVCCPGGGAILVKRARYWGTNSERWVLPSEGRGLVAAPRRMSSAQGCIGSGAEWRAASVNTASFPIPVSSKSRALVPDGYVIWPQIARGLNR